MDASPLRVTKVGDIARAFKLDRFRIAGSWATLDVVRVMGGRV